MRVTKPKRGKRPVRRLDLTDIRAALRDGRQWTTLARVIVADGQSSHFELHTNRAGELVDILVDVETIPDRLDLTCSLTGGWGGWWIPEVGDEVIVVLPAGAIDFRPTIVATAPASIPNPRGQGPAPGRRVFVADEVLVHSGAGGAEPLVRKSEYDELKKVFDGHKHPGLFGGTGSVAGLTGPPSRDPAGTLPDPAPTITGTQVLKGT